MSQPKLLSKPWAADGLKNEIPASRTGGVAQEAATYTEGFPSITMTPIAMGGKPPSGKDMNGVLYELSAHTVYLNQGGRYRFDQAFCNAIGGYPKGAVLMNNAGTAEYISLINGNTANFNISTVNIGGKWAVWSSAETLAGKADKTVTITAGAGLTGGGTLADNRTLSLGTPGTITASSGNSVTAASHTHAIDSALLVPSGTVAWFAGNTAPAGWLKANGAAVSRTAYANLFAAIGTTYGTGNGSSTFNLPDLRGEFVRGWDDGRGADAGRSLGSWQKGSGHTVDTGPTSVITADYSNSATGALALSDAGYDAANPADYPQLYANTAQKAAYYRVQNTNELMFGAMRPRNVALLACIKI